MMLNVYFSLQLRLNSRVVMFLSDQPTFGIYLGYFAIFFLVKQTHGNVRPSLNFENHRIIAYIFLLKQQI